MKLSGKKGFGVNEILLIAAGVVVLAAIVIPGVRGLAESIMTKLNNWWTDISNVIFFG